jgi:ADP-heptose:LPS heptosyltransferase
MPLSDDSNGARDESLRQLAISSARRDALRKRLRETVEALTRLGDSLYALNRLSEAASAYEAALTAWPNDPAIMTHLANVMLAENKLPQAIEGYERALAFRPDDPWIRYCLGLAYLTSGDFVRGWEHFEARLDRQPLWSEFNRRRWQGMPSSPAGKSMLLVTEQGLGDVIHFIRYVPAVVAMGFRVSVLVDAGLKPLLAAQPWLEAVYDKHEQRPDFDEYCPLLSLPWILCHNPHAPPATVPYLTVSPDSLSAARKRLAGFGGAKIGFVWAGNPKHEKDKIRSMSLKRMAAVFPKEGASLFSLQKEIPATDRIAFSQLPELHDLSDALSDFAATAALVAELDLVVTVDTSVAHLAGALGVPVWILLPFAPDWRWQLGRSDSPWYPTVRLYRQPTLDDWTSPLSRVEHDLTEFVRNRKA